MVQVFGERPSRATSPSPWLLVGLLVLLWAVSTWPCLGWGLYQDDIHLQFHLHFRGLKWYHAFYRDCGAGYVRTFIQLLFHAGRDVFGLSAWAWTATAAVLHLLASLSVWLLGTRLLRNRFWAWVAAALFCIHFAHWDVHFWPGGVNDTVLMTGFCLSLWAHVRWIETRRARFLTLSLGGLFLAAMGKEHAVLIAPTLLLLEVALRAERRDHEPWRALAWRLLPAVSVCLMVAALVFWVQLSNPRSLSRSGRFRLASVHTVDSWCTYLEAQAWPYFRLTRFPQLPDPRPSPPWWIRPPAARLPGCPAAFRISLDFMILGGFVAALLLLWRSRRWRDVFLLLWMAGMAVPGAMVQTGLFTRYAYPPSVPAMLLVGSLCQTAVLRGWERRWLMVPGLGFFALVSIASFWMSPSRLRMKWESQLTLALIRQLQPTAPEVSKDTALVLINHPRIAPREFAWLYWHSVLYMAGVRGELPEVYWVDSRGPLPELDRKAIYLRWDEATGTLTPVSAPDRR